MKDVNYSDWSEYLLSIFNNYGNNGNHFLEIAGGTGTLAYAFQKFHPDIILTDLSIQMLKQAKIQNRVCCDMRFLPFKRKFDFIFSTFDSLNYLLEIEDLICHFKEIYNLLDDKGIYTFDVSLEPNSLNNIGIMNRSGNVDDIYFKQISRYNKSNKIHTNKFEFYQNGVLIFEESHSQKIFPMYIYFDIINKSNMFAVECFDSFSYQDANVNSERVQFIIKKINHGKSFKRNIQI